MADHAEFLSYGLTNLEMCPEIGGDQPLKILGIFSCNHTDVLIIQIAAMH